MNMESMAGKQERTVIGEQVEEEGDELCRLLDVLII